jgi:hypothetical protein
MQKNAEIQQYNHGVLYNGSAVRKYLDLAHGYGNPGSVISLFPLLFGSVMVKALCYKPQGRGPMRCLNFFQFT